MANEEGDKKTMRGYVYLMDDGRDLKLGITSNIKNRLRSYITENPRLKVHDSYEVECFTQAEKVEKELIKATKDYRTHGKEWCEHCEEVFQIWRDVSQKYARRTYDEWYQQVPTEELNKALLIVWANIRKKLKKQKYFAYEKAKDFTISSSDYFDGTIDSARQIVFDDARKTMAKEGWDSIVNINHQDLAIEQREVDDLFDEDDDD